MTDLQVSGRNITVSGTGDTVTCFNAFAEESAGLRAKLTESGIGGCTLVTVDVPDWDAALSPWQAEALSKKRRSSIAHGVCLISVFYIRMFIRRLYILPAFSV